MAEDQMVLLTPADGELSRSLLLRTDPRYPVGAAQDSESRDTETFRLGSMKIALVNNYYYLRGGSERVLCDDREALIAAGHEVLPFAPRDERTSRRLVGFFRRYRLCADQSCRRPMRRWISFIRPRWGAPLRPFSMTSALT